MAESSKNKWFSDNLSEKELKEELEKRNLLPYFGITSEILEKISSPSLENLCEAIKTIPLPYEVLIAQNPLENIAMYLTIIELKKQNKQFTNLSENLSKLISNVRDFYWKSKDFTELSASLEYPLKVLPGNLHQRRLENLPKQIVNELEQAISSPYSCSEERYTRERAINEISEDLYRIYKQNNQF